MTPCHRIWISPSNWPNSFDRYQLQNGVLLRWTSSESSRTNKALGRISPEGAQPKRNRPAPTTRNRRPTSRGAGSPYRFGLLFDLPDTMPVFELGNRSRQKCWERSLSALATRNRALPGRGIRHVRTFEDILCSCGQMIANRRPSLLRDRLRPLSTLQGCALPTPGFGCDRTVAGLS